MVRTMRGFNHLSEILHTCGGSPYKGIPFVEALPVLRAADPAERLRFVGMGAMSRSCAGWRSNLECTSCSRWVSSPPIDAKSSHASFSVRPSSSCSAPTNRRGWQFRRHSLAVARLS